MSTILLADVPPRSRPPRSPRRRPARREPWEVILDQIPESQRRLYLVDDAVSARVLRAYVLARQRVADDVARAWTRTQQGQTGTPLQRLNLLRSSYVLGSLSDREREIRGESITAVQVGFDTARVEAHVQASEEREAMAQAFPVLRASLAHPGARGQRGARTSLRPFVAPPTAAEEILVDNAVQSMTQIAEATRNQASEELIAGTLRGDSVDVIRRRLTPIFDGNSRRATLVTRHVVIRAYNESREIGYGDVQTHLAPYGRTVLKMWITELDRRACPICLALHGTLTGLDGNFDLTLTFASTPPQPPWPDPLVLRGPPRHPRCRCTHAPWVSGWQAATVYTPEFMQRQARQWAYEAGILDADEVVPAITPAAPSPVSDLERVHSASIRSLPPAAFASAVSAYLSCARGSSVLPRRRTS